MKLAARISLIKPSPTLTIQALAYMTADAALRSSQSEQEFTKTVKELSLTEYASASWISVSCSPSMIGPGTRTIFFPMSSCSVRAAGSNASAWKRIWLMCRWATIYIRERTENHGDGR